MVLPVSSCSANAAHARHRRRTARRLATSGVESLGVVFVQQLDGDEVTLVACPRVAQLQRKAWPVAVGTLGEVDPVLDLRRRHGVEPATLLALAGGIRYTPRPREE